MAMSVNFHMRREEKLNVRHDAHVDTVGDDYVTFGIETGGGNGSQDLTLYLSFEQVEQLKKEFQSLNVKCKRVESKRLEGKS